MDDKKFGFFIHSKNMHVSFENLEWVATTF